jgi:hypothetical protein
MKSVMATAVDDGIVERNPCRVRGAGQDRSPERPVLSVGEVVALPVMQHVQDEAHRRKIDLIILPTAQAVGMLTQTTKDTNAILHLTC